jgi:Cysteine rich repeat
VTIGDHETADFSDQSYPPVSPSSFRPCQKWKTDADLPTLKMVIRGCPFDDVNLRRCDCRCLLTTQSTFAASLGKICAADIKAQCADVKPGGGALKDCIKTHFSDLAEDCQVAIIRAAAVGRACKADAQQFCSDVKPGNGTVAGCMKSHAADLSEGCRAAIANANGDETNPYCQLSPLVLAAAIRVEIDGRGPPGRRRHICCTGQYKRRNYAKFHNRQWKRACQYSCRRCTDLNANWRDQARRLSR